MGVAVWLLFLAVVAGSHAATDSQEKGKDEQKSTQGQQLCPPVAAKDQSQVQLECKCSPVKAAVKTAREMELECKCSPVKSPRVPEKKPK
jgi:hypothetical protein